MTLGFQFHGVKFNKASIVLIGNVIIAHSVHIYLPSGVYKQTCASALKFSCVGSYKTLSLNTFTLKNSISTYEFGGMQTFNP